MMCGVKLILQLLALSFTDFQISIPFKKIKNATHKISG